MKKIRCLSITLALLAASSATNILECDFIDKTWTDLGEVYVCQVNNIKDMDKMDEINDFSGTHLKSRSNNDVEGIFARNETMERIPKGLEKIFPNLKTIMIENVGLKEIHGDDLKPFKSLEHLYLYGNKITDLEMNVFSGNPKLKRIILYENPINFIFPDVFSNLYELEYLDLVGNTCRDIEYEDARRPEILKKLVSSIEVGGCLENEEDYDIIKDRFFTRINSKTLSKVRSCEKDKKTLQSDFDKKLGELKKCQIDKDENEVEEGYIRQLEGNVTKLEGDIENLTKDKKECEEKYQAFKKEFEDLKDELEKESNVTGPRQVDALQKRIDVLEFEIKTQENTLSLCENRTSLPPACEPIILQCDDDDLDNDTILNQFIEQLNKTSDELYQCKNDLENKKDEVYLCKKEKGKTQVELRKCEMNRNDCKVKTTIIPPVNCPSCNCSTTCDTTNLEKRHKKCSDDLYKCNGEKNNLIREINLANITIKNHDALMNSANENIKRYETRYAILWESCTKGSVKPGLNPKCVEPKTMENPYSGTPEFVDIIPNWPAKEQCKIYGSNIQDRLDYCNKKLRTSYNFMTTYGEFFMNFPKMNYDSPPSIFGKCDKNNDDDSYAEGNTYPPIGRY